MAANQIVSDGNPKKDLVRLGRMIEAWDNDDVTKSDVAKALRYASGAGLTLEDLIALLEEQ